MKRIPSPANAKRIALLPFMAALVLALGFHGVLGLCAYAVWVSRPVDWGCSMGVEMDPESFAGGCGRADYCRRHRQTRPCPQCRVPKVRVVKMKREVGSRPAILKRTSDSGPGEFFPAAPDPEPLGFLPVAADLELGPSFPVIPK